jgi:hypothetical protein
MALQLRAAVRGTENAVKALQRLGANVQRAARTTAADVAAQIVMEEVEQRVPVLTGRLKRSEGAEVQVDSDSVKILIGPQEGHAEWERGRLQDPEQYGEIIEAKGTPLGRAKGFHKKAAKAAFPRVVAAVNAILQAAATGNVFIGKD